MTHHPVSPFAIAAAAAMISCAGTPVLAQGSSPRQHLNFTLAPSQAYDSELPAELQSRLVPDSPQAGGYSTMLMAAGDYAWRRPAGQIQARGSSAFRYYAGLDQVRSLSHDAYLAASARLARNSTLRLSQAAAYSPSYLYRLFPGITAPDVGDAVPSAPDYKVDEQQSYSYNTTLAITHGARYGHRLSAAGDFDQTDFRGAALNRLDLRTYGAQGKYSRGLGRTGSLSAGYHYRTGEFGHGGATTEHTVPVGFDYSRALSATRRAGVRISVAPSRLQIAESGQLATVTGSVYKLAGEVGLDYGFLRGWQARLQVRRRLEYVATHGEPVFADGATVAVDGVVTRRVGLLLSAAYASGESILDRNALAFDSYTGNLRLQYALTRTLAVYGEYLYYFYDFRGSSGLAADLPSRLERNGVRAGLTLRVPVIGR